jgi:hypothetical protein
MPHAVQKCGKSVTVQTQIEFTHSTFIFNGVRDCFAVQNIFLSPSKKIKTPDTQTDTTKTLKRSIDNSFHGWWSRTTSW